MARAALNWTLERASDRSGVSRNTIARLERGEPSNQSTITALRLTFEAAGVIFLDGNGTGPGVCLRKS